MDDGGRPPDEEWLDPNLPGRPLRALIRERRGFLFRALALALLLIVLLIGTGRPGQSPTPTAGVRIGPPPTGRQLLWFSPSPEPGPLAVRVQALDWGGHELGTLALPCRAPCSFSPSPDGQRLLVYERPPLGRPPIPGTVYDAAGRRVGAVDNPFAIWADDSRHLCLLRGSDPTSTAAPSSLPAALEILDPDHGQARVAASITAGSGSSGPAYWELLACSIAVDRAVVVSGKPQGLHEVRVVQPSTGRTLYSRDDMAAGAQCGCLIADLLVTPDGGIAVENLVAGGVQLRNLSTGATAPLPSGSVMSGSVLGLSWQGRRALTNAGVIDLGTGRVLWRAPSPSSVSLIARRPGSDDLLLYLSRPNSTGARYVIVQSGGRQIPLPLSVLGDAV